MKKQFWISGPPIFSYGPLKIAIFDVFFRKKVLFSKMWQKFLSEISVEISVAMGGTPQPPIVRTRDFITFHKVFAEIWYSKDWHKGQTSPKSLPLATHVWTGTLISIILAPHLVRKLFGTI